MFMLQKFKSLNLKEDKYKGGGDKMMSYKISDTFERL